MHTHSLSTNVCVCRDTCVYVCTVPTMYRITFKWNWCFCWRMGYNMYREKYLVGNCLLVLIRKFLGFGIGYNVLLWGKCILLLNFADIEMTWTVFVIMLIYIHKSGDIFNALRIHEIRKYLWKYMAGSVF